ncbi:protein DitI [Pseudomonas aeruginosa]|nr:protein DitI [Pseudomonas aeruginosa]
MNLLQGQVALITGAGGGIGRGVALSFARAGAAVLVAELDEASGKAVEQELQALGARALFVRTDVTRKADIEAPSSWRSSASVAWTSWSTMPSPRHPTCCWRTRPTRC